MSLLQSRLLTLGVMLIAVGSSNSSTNAQDQATTIAISETWLRKTVQVSDAAPADAVLRLWASDVTSVYVNGQRLLRNQTVNGLFAWKVGTLLRSGDNCIAVAVAKSESERVLAAWLTGTDSVKLKYAPWKTTDVIPPVGWQSTDFNDRDWKVAPQHSVDTTFGGSAVTELSWMTDNSPHVKDGRFSFHDGDHVVLLGGTFIERAQQYGYLESALTTAAAADRVTFRNLGWSADTVFAESRGIFDSPAKGYERMIEHVRAEEPTVVLVCYGQNEALSFARGPAGIERFQTQLKTLYRDLTSSGAEVIFLTPHPFVTLAGPLPDAAIWNEQLSLYSDAVKKVAAELEAFSVDLNTDFVRDIAVSGSDQFGVQKVMEDPDGHPELMAARNSTWTDNGMHWNAAGYQHVAPVVASRLLGLPIEHPTIMIDADAKTVTASSGRIRNITWPNVDIPLLSFEYQPHRLTSLPVSLEWTTATIAQPVSAVDTQVNDFEALRQLVIQKNELYFHRWRPQNITYLFGFRKHEQGNNASDIAKFDPLIEDLERQIAKARQAKWQTIRVKVPD